MSGHHHGHGGPRGVASYVEVPTEAGLRTWDHVFLQGEQREALLRRAVFTMRNRGRLAGMRSALQGIFLFSGPPGTGKSTTATALVHRVAAELADEGTSSLVRIDAHSLPSSSLGESQQNVRELLGPVITEYTHRTDRVFVIIDEVEAFAVRRSTASFETNPVDVHRATDAVLEGLDALLFAHPNLLFIMTTNFPDAVDEAVLSRVDVHVPFELPDADQIAAILADTLDEYARVWPELGAVRDDREGLLSVARASLGRSGREIRRVVLDAIVAREATVDDPGRLTIPDLVAVSGGIGVR